MAVKLVCGPPAAGKTSYVADKAAQGDTVIDYDVLRAQYGDAAAKQVRKSLESVVQTMPGDVWVIRSLAKAEQRTDAAKRLGASEVIVLATPAEVAKERATKRGDQAEKIAAIDRWWNDYSVVQSDVIVWPATDQIPSDKENPMSKKAGQNGSTDDPQNNDPQDNENQDNSDDKDLGFPKDTPVNEMKPEEQAAYWKHKARKHEGIAKSRADYDQLKELADKWRDHERNSKPEDERKLDDVKEQERKAERLRLAPELVKAKFEAQSAGKVPEETLEAFLEDLNFAAYLKDDGTVDTDRVKQRVEKLTPPKQNTRQNHGGFRPSSGATSVTSGRELFKSSKKK